MVAALLSLQLNAVFATASALWVIAASLGEVWVNKKRARIGMLGICLHMHSALLAHLCQSLMSAQELQLIRKIRDCE